MTEPTVVWLDCETTGLHDDRRAWDVAAIVRRPEQPDVEWQWYVNLWGLDISWADPTVLAIGGFWDRHPQARWVMRGDNRVWLAPDCPRTLPDDDGTVSEETMLTGVAGLVAGKAIVAGSNPDFDRSTLGPRMGLYGIAPGWHYHPEDTPTLARGWLLAQGRRVPAPRRSDDIARACGVDPDDYERHTALGDCRMMRDLNDRVEGRWRPGPPRSCSTDHVAGRCGPPVVMVAGEPRCARCADFIDPAGRNRQSLPTRTVIR